MRDPQGYSIVTDPRFSRPIERDTTTCGHCNAVSFTEREAGKPQVLIFRMDGTHYMKDVGFCRKCWRYICPRCEGKRDCTPFEAKLEIEEAVARKSLWT
jgi:hypothetical protein